MNFFSLNQHCIADTNMHAKTHTSASKFYVDIPAGKKSLQLLQLYLCVTLFSFGLFCWGGRVQGLENTAQNPQDGLDECVLAWGA